MSPTQTGHVYRQEVLDSHNIMSFPYFSMEDTLRWIPALQRIQKLRCWFEDVDLLNKDLPFSCCKCFTPKGNQVIQFSHLPVDLFVNWPKAQNVSPWLQIMCQYCFMVSFQSQTAVIAHIVHQSSKRLAGHCGDNNWYLCDAASHITS